MAKYRFICDKCNSEYCFNMSIEEYDKAKGSIFCEKDNNSLKRVYGNFSLKVAKTSIEIAEDIKKEKNKILEKAKSGDMSTILDIYGE